MENDTYRLNYWDSQGIQTSHQTIVLLHGFMGRISDWDLVIQELRDKLHYKGRIVCFDLPGHGQSSLPEGLSFDQFLEIFGVQCEDLNLEKSYWVGYSLGGRVALHLALKKAKFFDGLILESASPGLDDHKQRELRESSDRQLFSKVCQGIETMEQFVDKWYRLPIFRGIRKTDKFRSLAEKVSSNSPETLQMALNLMSVGSIPSLWGRVSNLNFPILYLTGELDEKYVEIGQRLVSKNSHASLELIKNTSHNTHFSEPEIFSEYLRSFIRW